MSADLPDPYSAAARVAQKLGLPEQALIELLKGDHWSLVIKAAAIIEGAFNDLLAAELNRVLPTDVARELGAKYTREWLLEIGAIDKQAAEMAEAVANLRNKLAHAPGRVVGFSLTAYRDELDANQQESLLRKLGFRETDVSLPDSIANGQRLWAQGDSRLIWYPMMSVLSFVELRHREHEVRAMKADAEAKEAAAAALHELIKSILAQLGDVAQGDGQGGEAVETTPPVRE